MAFLTNSKSLVLIHIYASYLWPAMRFRQSHERTMYLLESEKNNLSSAAKKEGEQVNSNQLITCTRAGDRDYDSKFGLIPEIPRVGFIYYCLSTGSLLAMLIVCSLFYDRILDKSGENYFLSCVWPRMLIHEQISQPLSLVICWNMCSLHLVWRLMAVTFVARKQATFETFQFMLADENVIQRVIDIFGTDHWTGFKWSQSIYDQQLIESWQFKSLRDCLFHQFGHQTYGAKYRLRLNRTLTTQRKLIFATRVASLMLLFGYFYCTFAIVLGIPTLIYRQHMIYEGCPKIEFMDPIYWLRLVSSGAFSLIAMIDSAAFGLYFVLSGLSVVYDAYLYWGRLRERINRMSRELHHHQASKDFYNFSRHSPLAQRVAHDRTTENWQRKQLLRLRNQRDYFGTRFDKELEKLRASFVDFFGQVRKFNRLIDIMITFVISGWLAFNVVFTLTGVQTGTSIDRWNHQIVRVFQMVGFVFFFVSFALPLIELRRIIQSGYPTICSLMALDMSANKTKWAEILMHYTYRPTYAFTCFESKIFSRIILMQVLSYTITVVFVIEILQGAN